MKVETQEFNEMVNKIPEAISGTVSDSEFIRAGGGVWKYKVYTFNYAIGKYQEHILRQEGDTYYFNTHPAAIDLST